MISVIVPVYNVEDYLHRCIDSILSQTYRDFELILVDDESTDNSGSICEDYKRVDNRVHVIHKKNGGVSSARNAGISVATGEFITFFDSDDYVKEDYLQRMIQSIEENNADLSVCGFDEVGENGNIINTFVEEERTVQLYNAESVITFIFNVLSGVPVWSVWCRMWRTSIIKENSIAFCETSENYAEDLTFYLEYLLYCKSISFMDYVGYNYFQRGNSMMHKCKEKYKLNAVNENSSFLYKYFNKNIDMKKYIQYFPIIHFLMMDTEYKRIQYRGLLQNIKCEIDKIIDYSYYRKMTKRILSKKRIMKKYFNNDTVHRMRIISLFCLTNNFKMFCLLDGFYCRLTKKKAKGQRI